MRFLKHLAGLLSEFFHFAKENKAWWIVPIVIILLLITVLAIASSSVAPFIYPLF